MRNKDSGIFKVGIVEDYNPTFYTVDVRLDDGEYLTSVAVLNEHGTTFGKDVASLQSLRGANVLALIVGGHKICLGTIPTRVTESETIATIETPEAATAGGNPNAYIGVGFHNFSAGRPQGMLPGDKVLRADDGETELGLYKGGLVRLRASSMAQFLLGKVKDFFRLIGRTGQIFTDFGEVKFTHSSSGRVGLQILGGADFATETHPDKETWTVKVYLGDDPSTAANRVYVEAANAAGTEKATIAMDNTGKMTLYATGDMFITSGGEVTIDASKVHII